MLKKKERLSRSEFEAVYTKGRRYSAPNFSVIIAPHKRGACAVVVSKKTAKNASARNSLRRRWYSALGDVRALWVEKGCIIILKSSATSLSLKEVQTELEHVFQNSVRT